MASCHARGRRCSPRRKQQKRSCSMSAAFMRMPSVARNAVRFVFNVFTHSTNTTVQPETSAAVFQRKHSSRRKSDPQMYSTTENPVEECSHVSSAAKKFDIEKWEPTWEEKELLKRTWSNDFEFLYDLGTSIYAFIFESHPRAKELFPFLAKYGDQWRESKEFRAQALKFVQILSTAVKSLYHMEQLVPILYTVGEAHCAYANRGFEAQFWDIFLLAMKVSLSAHIASLETLDEQQKEAATEAWRTLSLYVITHMKRGFNDGLKRMAVTEKKRK